MDRPSRSPHPVMLAASTVGGAGTTVALRAALRQAPPPGARALVPLSLAEDSEAAGWSARPVGRVRGLLLEAVASPRSGAWIGFCDRLPLVRRPPVTLLVVQNPHLYGPIDRGWRGRERLKLRLLARWARHSARRATLVVCSTRSSAEAVTEATGIREAAVVVRPIPAAAPRFVKTEHRDRIERVLLVGDAYPYKRLPDAVQAVVAFAIDHRRAVTLVHVGNLRDRVAGAEVRGALVGAQAAGITVISRSQIDHAEVLVEMAQADVLVMPSTTETQGLPLVEAQAVGLPVLARAIGPFTDLGGEAAAYVPVEAGPAELATALAALDPRAERERLATLGRELHEVGGAWDLLGLLTLLDQTEATDR